MDQRLELGVTAIIRQNDYKDLYKSQPNPGRLRVDSKYVLLFRACLLRVESAIVQRGLLTKDARLNVVMEDGAANAGDARRFFELAKKEHYPEWADLLGTLTFGQKESCGLQAADLLVYYANKLERKDHWIQPTDVAKSRYASSKLEPASPRFVEYRLPITGDTLRSLAADFQKPPDQWANMQSK